MISKKVKLSRPTLPHPHKILLSLFIVSILVSVTLLVVSYTLNSDLSVTKTSLATIMNAHTKTTAELQKVTSEFEAFKKTDQVKRNDENEAIIKDIQATFTSSTKLYEQITDLPSTSKELPKFKKEYAKILKTLSEKNYSSASADMKLLASNVEKERTALLSSNTVADLSLLTPNNAPPGSGFSRQRVDALSTSFLVDIVAGNLGSTRVIVDTASDSDCRDNCPTLPLGTYVARNGAYAGVNGSYFCPADYPSCAGKTNSFDTLAMGKNKHYHNSDNNVYSTVPAVVFGDGWIRFVGQSHDWGRDTGVNGVLANQPLLLSGGNVMFGGDGDPKKGSRGNRSFVANKGNTVYIGVVRNATVAEVAHILKAMGMEGALNLDSGGSTALWAGGGYKAGPGRAIPNAILFVNK